MTDRARPGAVAALALLLTALVPRARAAGPDEVPTGPWPVAAPADVGLDGARLEALALSMGGRGCVVRHGRVAFIWGDVQKRGDMASAVKPVYAHFPLAARAAGQIPRLDEAVVVHEPRLADLNPALGPRDRGSTWRHLVNQTSGYGIRSRPGRLAIPPRDFARLGLLDLHDGRWGERVVLSSDLVKLATRTPLPSALPRTRGEAAPRIADQRSVGGGNNQTDPNGSYRFAGWTNGLDRTGARHWPQAPVETFAALGHGGRRSLVIVPSLDLIASWNDATVENRQQQDQALGLLAAAVVPAPEAVPAPPDAVIRGARVVTLDARSRIAQAVALRGDRIVAVGSDAEIEPLAGPTTRRIDARGATLLPGLYDSHVHPLGASSSEREHPIPVFDSLAAIREYILGRAHAQPAGTWIVVRYAFPTRLAEGRLPTRAELDAVAPEHPVLHQAGPAGVANTRALDLSGITAETPDPPGGQIVKDPRTGEPTGLLRNAYSLLRGLPADAYGGDAGAEEARLVELLGRYNERGLTSIADRAASDSALELYRGLRDAGRLTVRVHCTRVLAPPFGDRAAIVQKLQALEGRDRPEPNGPTGGGDHWVRIGPMKVFLDGGMLNGTAYMREPWGMGPAFQVTEPAYRGLMFLTPETLATIATEAARRGWVMTAHCAGEAGMDELLSAYETADRVIGIRGRRWLITHANFTSAENLRRCAELGVGADVQPAWLWKDARTLRSVLGERRMAWFHPYRKWLDAGVVIGGGSDHMIRMEAGTATNPWDPWLGMWIAVTRNVEGGEPLNPDQRLSREEALRLYTIDNARLHGEEAEKGSVEPGKLADLILVERDPLRCSDEELRAMRVLWTMVGGRIVAGKP